MTISSSVECNAFDSEAQDPPGFAVPGIVAPVALRAGFSGFVLHFGVNFAHKVFQLSSYLQP